MANKKTNDEMIGQKFGRLTVLERDESRASGTGIYYVCKCDCGTVKTVRGTNLRGGNVKSCGCMHKESAAATGKANEGRKHLHRKPRNWKPKPHKPFDISMMKEYERFRSLLCATYERKCLTRKCPLSKYSCYEYMTFKELAADAPRGMKNQIVKRMQEVADEMYYDLP